MTGPPVRRRLPRPPTASARPRPCPVPGDRRGTRGVLSPCPSCGGQTINRRRVSAPRVQRKRPAGRGLRRSVARASDASAGEWRSATKQGNGLSRDGVDWSQTEMGRRRAAQPLGAGRPLCVSAVFICVGHGRIASDVRPREPRRWDFGAG